MALAKIRQVVKKHSDRTAAIAQLGLQEDKLRMAIACWLGSPCKSVHEAAQEVVNGRPRAPLAKLLAVEREITMNELGRRKRITLYRGVDGDYAQNIRTVMRKRKKVNVPLRGAQSWTDNYKIAQRFGGVVLTANIPTQYIVACYRTNPQIQRCNESEYIVAIPKKTITIRSEHIADFK